MIPAYSTTTGLTYPSWEDLVEAEANGYVAVAIMQRQGPKKLHSYCRVVGPFPTKSEAQSAAEKIKRRFKKAVSTHQIDPGTELLAVTVEPSWNQVWAA